VPPRGLLLTPQTSRSWQRSPDMPPGLQSSPSAGGRIHVAAMVGLSQLPPSTQGLALVLWAQRAPSTQAVFCPEQSPPIPTIVGAGSGGSHVPVQQPSSDEHEMSAQLPDRHSSFTAQTAPAGRIPLKVRAHADGTPIGVSVVLQPRALMMAKHSAAAWPSYTILPAFTPAMSGLIDVVSREPMHACTSGNVAQRTPTSHTASLLFFSRSDSGIPTAPESSPRQAGSVVKRRSKYTDTRKPTMPQTYHGSWCRPIRRVPGPKIGPICLHASGQDEGKRDRGQGWRRATQIGGSPFLEVVPLYVPVVAGVGCSAGGAGTSPSSSFGRELRRKKRLGQSMGKPALAAFLASSP